VFHHLGKPAAPDRVAKILSRARSCLTDREHPRQSGIRYKRFCRAPIAAASEEAEDVLVPEPA